MTINALVLEAAAVVTDEEKAALAEFSKTVTLWERFVLFLARVQLILHAVLAYMLGVSV